MFAETPTLGIRRTTTMRTALARQPHEVATRLGSVPGKVAHLPDGSRRFIPEYEACREIAERNKVSLAEVMAAAQAAFRAAGDSSDRG